MKIHQVYLKESPIGKKYLGITTRDPYYYIGSGAIWRKHLKENNFKRNDIKTTILFSSPIEELANFVGFEYSELFNIVESEEFANQMPESGRGQTRGRVVSKETRIKISKANKGRKPSKETIRKILQNRKSTKGFKHSEETKRKLSECRKGKKLSRETIEKIVKKTKGKRLEKNFKAVHQYDLEGNYIQSFPSIIDAKKKYPNCDIYNASKGVHETAGGFQWRSYSKKEKQLCSVEKKIQPIKERKCKKIFQYSIENEFIKEWNGTKEPSKELGISRTGIRNCLCGISQTSGGFKWLHEKIKTHG